MATTIPRPGRPSLGPPNTALPALPGSSQGRKSTGAMSTAANLQAAQGLSKSGLRSPSAPRPAIPSSPGQGPSSTLPKVRSSMTNNVGKTLRKTISINSFPQPPRGDPRQSSLPSSPLSGGARPSSAHASIANENRDSTASPALPSGKTLRRKPTKSGLSTPQQSVSGISSPSFLNGAGDRQSISSAPGARGSDGLLSLPSPPQSRSSSANGSYSTSATTYEENGANGDARGRPTSGEAGRRESKAPEGKGNVVVSVRVRPDTGAASGPSDGEWMVDGRRSLLAYRGREGGDYYYDNVFATQDNNARVYDSCAKRLVRRVMEGYHGTVFAYGMTGTGKTFSMQGTLNSPGVIPLAINDIFSYIRETPSREFLLRVSYLEIYNEKIHDLLNAPAGGFNAPGEKMEEIKLREDSKRGVYATPLKEEIVQSPTQLIRVIGRGDNARRVSSTQFNARSSRSHAVVQIVVESRERTPGNGAMENKRSAGITPGGVRVSTLSLIDLAGSERAAETKERRTEGSHINKSLLTLGTVIARLSETKDANGKESKDGRHLPYRDSKLTRLLQGALSGGALVSILCTIQIGAPGSAASSSTHTSETLNTLKFASRAKNNIVSHAKKAEEALGAGGDGGARVLLERYRMEIEELKKQLQDQGQAEPKPKLMDDVDEETERRLEKEAEQRREEQTLELQLARTALKERIDHLNRLILSSKSTGVNTSGSYSSLGFNPRFSILSASGQFSSRSSIRSSITPSTIGPGDRHSVSRTASNGSLSTINQLRSSSHSPDAHEEDDSGGEFGDGIASLANQNQALQVDLADKNRYIATLEKRLVHARRSSQSKASGQFTGNGRGPVLVGEDCGVAQVMREKDEEIRELRAMLDDKDRMLSALRSAVRNRDTGEGTKPPSSPGALSVPPSPSPSYRVSLQMDGSGSPMDSRFPSPARPAHSPMGKKRNKSVDEVSRILDEMIGEKVSTGDLVRSKTGTIRLPAEDRSFGAENEDVDEAEEMEMVMPTL